MPESNAFVIRSRGSLVTVIENRVFATLLSEPPTVFTVRPGGDGTVALLDKESGRHVSASPPEQGIQLVTSEEPASWVLRQLNEDNDPIQVGGVTEAGHYTIELAGTGLYAGRARIEDLSLMPKRIILTDEQGEPVRLVLQPVD